jgi:hypothetical protein
LEERGKFDPDRIENERRDLASVRLILYTNTDIERVGWAKPVPAKAGIACHIVSDLNVWLAETTPQDCRLGP